MATTDFDQFLERYHQSVNAVVDGDPEPQKQLYSRGDDATLANPLGPPARGWSQISAALDHAAAQLRDGEPLSFEHVSGYATADLAYTLEIQRGRVKLAGADELTLVALRVTTIFRREEPGWRVVHRHADPITTSRPASSMVLPT